LLVHYDPLRLTYRQVTDWILPFLAQVEAGEEMQTRVVEIPTYYGGKYGPDLESLAKLHNLTPMEVIKLHSAAEYRVYMMGFTPGFPYLGGLDPALATPRLAAPRTLVPAGSVAIAGSQTGIYPVDSPGGWQIIGYTPLHLFDKKQDPPSFLSPGDRVRFIPISGKEADNVH
jgi:inhibitor of KinA